ncbi:MAG: hypothetical protein GXY08_14225 [Ruminococcus sp.]|nr:hypothetical protein [Ruminococcus sp.]
MDEEYNYSNDKPDEMPDVSGQPDSGQGNYMPPPPQNGYGNNPPPPQNGYGNYPPPPQNGYGNYPPPPQNGYGNYPPPQNGYGNYPPPQQNGYGYSQNGGYPQPARSIPPSNSNGTAIAAMVTALANLILLNSLLSFITVPLAIILAIVALRKKKGSKVFSYIAIGASVLSALIFSLYIYYAVNIWPEAKYFWNNRTQIVDEYNRTGEIPERFDKFREGKYSPLWRMLGFRSFDAFFDDVAEFADDLDSSNNKKEIKKEEKPKERPTSPDEDHVIDEPETEEDPTYDYDHSGEDLVVLG